MAEAARPGWRERLAPWAGLIAGSVAAMTQQQVASIIAQDDCAAPGALISGGTGLIALLVVGFGGWLSLRVYRESNVDQTTPDAGSRRFIGAVSAMAAALFGLFIIVQILSGFIVPRCAA